MELLLDRRYKKDTYSIGKLYVDGVYFCDTLEPTDRGLVQSMAKAEIAKIKIKSKTAIPLGRYKVVMSWSGKFAKILPLVQGVTGFAGIRIHGGNTAKDTAGCILVGKNNVVGRVTNSTATLRILLAKLKNVSGIYITIK